MSSDRSNGRRYQALEYRCPACNAPAGEPCRRERDAAPMRGVHRRRDLVFNAHQIDLSEFADELGQAVGLR